MSVQACVTSRDARCFFQGGGYTAAEEEEEEEGGVYLRSVGSVLLRVETTNFLPWAGCNQVPSHGCLCISDERHFPGSRSGPREILIAVARTYRASHRHVGTVPHRLCAAPPPLPPPSLEQERRSIKYWKYPVGIIQEGRLARGGPL